MSGGTERLPHGDGSGATGDGQRCARLYGSDAVLRRGRGASGRPNGDLVPLWPWAGSLSTRAGELNTSKGTVLGHV